MRNSLYTWKPVGLIDGSLFVLESNYSMLVELRRGEPPVQWFDGPVDGYHDDFDADSFRVVNDKLFGLTHHPTTGDPEYLLIADPETDVGTLISNERIVDAYADWIA